MSNKNADYYFLRGGGEMGELIRAKDWSKTPLGDPSQWPQSLCTMVAVMLDNPFGMYIAWGKEYTQLYNDGYRPILGATKHPQALGIGTRETFSEIWQIVGPMFEGVMNGKAVGVTDFMYLLNRNGFVEECYFDFSYSPIRKDNGEIGGVLVTVIETTEKNSATTALKESNSRFINNILQAPVAMCIFRGKDHVVEIANEQMLNLWGKQSGQVMNKPIFEGLPEAKDQGLEPLLDKVYTTGEKFVANERPVNLPRNGKIEPTYVNFVYEALKETDGSISGIVAIAIEVTPQVEARSKVEESEQKVRALVKNAPFPIAVYVGKEMIIELANPSIINIWGKGDDVIGKSFKDVLPELDNQLVFEQIEKVFTTGESFHTQNTPLDLYVDGNLRTYYFNYSFTPLYDLNGNIYGVMNTGVDLTDLNIAKSRIEESDKRFRNTMKQAPVGITILRGPQYIVEMANDAYLQLLDKRESEFIGKSLFESLPEVEEVVHPLLDSVLFTGVPYHGNEVSIPVNRYGKQEVYYFDFLYHPLKEEDGNISGVIVAVTEVTEKVEARKAIEESEVQFRSLAQTLPQLVWVTDAQGNSEFASSRWEEYTGIKPRGEKEWRAVVHPDDYDKITEAWTQSLSTGKFYTFDARLKSKEGEYRWHTVKGEPLLDKENKIIKWVGAFTDIHDQKVREEKKDEFISIASHEMKTPLTTAKAYLQMLEETLNQSDEDSSLFAKKASQSVNRLNELISELLDVSKIQLGKLNYTIGTFNFNDMVDSAVENIQLTSTTHTIIKSGKVIDEVTGDKDRLQQVIINLLTNAIKYSPGSKKVFINVVQENDKITVSVKDTGIGIAKQSLDKIFEKYHREEEHAVQFQGLGIGLFISYEIIQRHHGKLWVESEQGKGSTFYFTIPVSSIIPN